MCTTGLFVIQYLASRYIFGPPSGTNHTCCALESLFLIKYVWFSTHWHSSCWVKAFGVGANRWKSLASRNGGTTVSPARALTHADYKLSKALVPRVLDIAITADTFFLTSLRARYCTNVGLWTALQHSLRRLDCFECVFCPLAVVMGGSILLQPRQRGCVSLLSGQCCRA